MLDLYVLYFLKENIPPPAGDRISFFSYCLDSRSDNTEAQEKITSMVAFDHNFALASTYLSVCVNKSATSISTFICS